jgi:hypothetical protein
VLRKVQRGVAEGVNEVSQVVDGASKRVDVVVRGIGLRWWHLLFWHPFFFLHFFFFEFFKERFLLFFLLNIMKSTILKGEQVVRQWNGQQVLRFGNMNKE